MGSYKKLFPGRELQWNAIKLLLRTNVKVETLKAIYNNHIHKSIDPVIKSENDLEYAVNEFKEFIMPPSKKNVVKISIKK